MHLFDKASFLTDALYNSAFGYAETRDNHHAQQQDYRKNYYTL